MDRHQQQKIMENIKRLKKQEEEMLKKYGWVVHFVFPEKEEDSWHVNYHTHGLQENFNHMDLQVTLPIDKELVHSILHDVVNDIKNGMKYEENKRYSNVIQGFDVKFKKFKEKEREVLRLMFPDANGFLPDENGCDPIYALQNKDIEGNEKVH